MKSTVFKSFATAVIMALPALGGAASQNLVVDGSLCVGFDCPASPSFGADTIRLQENNLRIHFEDTSVGSFPSNDWRIEANSNANGGASFFRLQDVTANTYPFRVDAGAPSNSLFVSSSGNVGISKGAPVTDLHIRSGNTPTMRLEQDGSSGFTPQTWDVAGNETNFFIRDATNGSRLPYKIFPNAPTNSLTIEGTTGHIGLGTASPAVLLHLIRGGAGADGLPRIEFDNTDATEDWIIDVADNNQFRISVDGSGAQEFSMAANGNLTIAGTLTQNSDKNAKMAIVEVDADEILKKVSQLDISEWSYKDDAGVRHIGPMAQDFYALFKTGATDKGITTIDTSGVALASIKAIHARLGELESAKAQILSLQEENKLMRAEIVRLDSSLRSLESGPAE
jgi:hypothetical protein